MEPASAGREGLAALIGSDLRAKAQWMYGDTSRRSLLKTCATDGTAAMVLYRMMQACERRRLSALSMVFNKLTAFAGDCIIGRGADFGPGFVLVHSNGVVINTSVRGGSNVFLEHQVTIGAERQQSPVLGDNVFVGAGAKIIGAVRIGSDVRIGANAVVIADVPSGATAVGVPARNIERRRPENASGSGQARETAGEG